MHNFNIKSIVLGMGIGIILTSLISMIYFAGASPGSKLSDEEIISKAMKLGMVKSEDYLRDFEIDSSKKVNSNSPSAAKTTLKTVDATTETPTTSEKKQVKKDIKLVIEPGDSSEKVAAKLLASGLIKEKDGFTNEMSLRKLSDKINTGEYVIVEGSSIDQIINKITGMK